MTMVVLIIFMSGCRSVQPKTETIYKDKYIPIIIVPHPPEIKPPDYYTRSLTEEQKDDIGEVSKAYIISSTEAINYIENLESIYETYKELAILSDRRLEALDNIGANIDKSLLEQTSSELNAKMKALNFKLKNTQQEQSEKLQSLKQINE
jgi:hypothetical protein